MPISESTLNTWSKHGSTTQFTKTYETIKEILDDGGSPFHSKKYKIFLQGSYKNDTNIPNDSDVDVVIRLDDIFWYDTDSLPASDQINFHTWIRKSEYSLARFKQDVYLWLKSKFGEDVKFGTKAINIKSRGDRRDADVLACMEYRRYTRFRNEYDQEYISGIIFFLQDNTSVINYPILHSDNCTIKHRDTGEWFKHTVRIFKTFRNVLIDQRAISDKIAPSYFIEGLLYNVPAVNFGGTEQQNFLDVCIWLRSANKQNFVCANEQHKLFDRTSNVSWRIENCDQLLYAMSKYWDSAR